MRTTVDLDAPVLRELKRLQKLEGKSLGRLVSDLVAQAISLRKAEKSRPVAFRWLSRPMRARIDLRDKEALHAALEADTRTKVGPKANVPG